MITITLALQAHINELKETIRESDKYECMAQTKLKHEKALQETLDSCSYGYVGINEDNKVIGFYGVAINKRNPVTSGIVFLIASNEINKLECGKYLISEAKKFIKAMLSRFDKLENIILAENTKSIAWLKRIGFNFSSEFQFNGHSFKHFWIEREV